MNLAELKEFLDKPHPEGVNLYISLDIEDYKTAIEVALAFPEIKEVRRTRLLNKGIVVIVDIEAMENEFKLSIPVKYHKPK